MNVPPPPKPPSGSRISLSWDKQTLRIVQGPFSIWRTAAAGALIQTDDATGRRITVTRALTIGLFALGAKKRTGHVSVVVTGRDGQWTMLRVPANKADAVLNWAFEWNTWSERTIGMQALPMPYPPAQPPHPGAYPPPPQPYYPPPGAYPPPGPYPPQRPPGR